MARRGAVVVGVGVVVAEIVAGDDAQVGVIDVHAGVDDRHDHGRVAVGLRAVPGGLGVGVEADGTDRRAGFVRVRGPVVGEELRRVVVPPVHGVERVGRHGRGEGAPVGTGRLHGGIGRVARGERRDVGGGRHLEQIPAVEADARRQGDVRGRLVGARNARQTGVTTDRVHRRETDGRPLLERPLLGADVQGRGAQRVGGELDQQAARRVRRNRLADRGRSPPAPARTGAAAWTRWPGAPRAAAGRRERGAIVPSGDGEDLSVPSGGPPRTWVTERGEAECKLYRSRSRQVNVSPA